MTADRIYRLTVVHPGNAADFARTLQSAISATASAGVVVEVKAQDALFEFITEWDVPIETFKGLSAQRKNETFLIEYSSPEDEFHGQLVIRNGALLEHFHRRGYYGPGPWYEITHPVPDLFEAHRGSRTLAQAANSRITDAISMVRLLKETIEEEGEAEQQGQNQHAKGTAANLSEMLQRMQALASRLRFDSVLGDRMARSI